MGGPFGSVRGFSPRRGVPKLPLMPQRRKISNCRRPVWRAGPSAWAALPRTHHAPVPWPWPPRTPATRSPRLGDIRHLADRQHPGLPRERADLGRGHALDPHCRIAASPKPSTRSTRSPCQASRVADLKPCKQVLQQTHRILAASLWQARGVGSAELLRARRNTVRHRPPGPHLQRLRYHLARSQHSRHPVFVNSCCEFIRNQPLIHHPSDSVKRVGASERLQPGPSQRSGSHAHRGANQGHSAKVLGFTDIQPHLIPSAESAPVWWTGPFQQWREDSNEELMVRISRVQRHAPTLDRLLRTLRKGTDSCDSWSAVAA